MSRLSRAFPDDPDVWDDPPLPPRRLCRCSHPQTSHGTDRRNRPTCFFAVCACTAYRPKEESA